MRVNIIIGLVLVSLILFGCQQQQVIQEPTAPVEVSEPKIQEPLAPELEQPAAIETIIEIYKTVPTPFKVTIKAGEIVTWANADKVAYKIIGDKQEPFESDPIGPGVAYQRAYHTPGEYTYYIIPGKAGKIIVTE